MRTEQELIELICNQIRHWINKCGRDEEDFPELVLEAEDLIMTDEEAMMYQRIGNNVKGSIIL